MGRIVRILALRNANTSSFTQFAEVEMIDTSIGLTDLCNGGTASSTGSINSGTAANAFANNGTTTFLQLSGGVEAGSLRYDFTGTVNEFPIIDRINIMGATGSGSPAGRAPGEFLVQQSDDGGTTWATIWEVSFRGYTTGVFQTFNKPTVVATHRYWRNRFETALLSIFSIAKMEMRSALGGADQCSGGTGIRSSEFSTPTYLASNAFDTDINTNWSSASGNRWEYLGYDFGGGNEKAIVEFSLLPRQGNSVFREWPAAIHVAASSDGVNWLPLWYVPKSLNTYSDGAYVFRDPAAVSPGSTHRWWGIQPTAVQSGTFFGVTEIEFRATLGGADLTTGGVAGSWRPQDSDDRPSNAFSGTSDDYASQSGFQTNDLIAYDYGHGNEKPIPAQIAIKARGDIGYSPTAFDLVYTDDGHTWTVQESFTSPATWTALEQRIFTVLGGVPATDRRRVSFM